MLTGEKRANKGLIKEQLDALRDKKKMAEMGFEEGIGFIPFAGIGYDDKDLVRFSAAACVVRLSGPGKASNSQTARP